MRHRLWSAILVSSVSISPCLAQNNQVRYDDRFYVKDSTGEHLAPLSELQRRAAKGDTFAKYLVGKDLESGIGTADGKPNLQLAIKSYEDAAGNAPSDIGLSLGTLAAIFRLGTLVEEGSVVYPNGRGGFAPDPSRGMKLKRFATERGYRPETESIDEKIDFRFWQRAREANMAAYNASAQTSSDTSLASLIAGALAVVVVGTVLAGDRSESPHTTGTGSTSGYLKSCIKYRDQQVLNPPGSGYRYGTKRVSYTAYGTACD